METKALGDFAHLCSSAVQVEQTGEPGVLVPEHDIFGDREDRNQHEVLVHHADASGYRAAWAGEVLHFVVEQDLTIVGLIQAVQDVHER